MKQVVGHRAFTYKEKKFNQLGRSGLIEYFKPKVSPEKIQDFAFEEHKQEITLTKAKQWARLIREKVWEEKKERRLFTETLVDNILHLTNLFDITNIEAFAMTCHIYKALGHKKNLTEEDRENIMEKALQEANELRQEN